MAVQDQVNEKTCNLAIKVTTKAAKLSGKALLWILRQGIDAVSTASENKTGKMSLKSLLKTSGGESTAEIDSKSKKDFDRLARRYGINYSIRRSPIDENGNYNYTVFVKSKDKAVLESMMKEYAKKVYNKDRNSNKKQSLSERLQKAKNAHKEMAKNVQKENIDNIKEKVKEIKR